MGLKNFYEIVSDIRHNYDITILLISHDLDLVAKHADRVVFINNSKASVGTVAEIYSQNDPDTVVLIHDGVRPLIIEDTISDNIKTVREKGNCITCIPATETFIVKQEDGSLEIPSRADSLVARAPQSFYLKDILCAHRMAVEEGKNDYIDSCTMMSHYGHRMNTIIGPMENIKITTPTDYFVFKAMVEVHENQQIFGF